MSTFVNYGVKAQPVIPNKEDIAGLWIDGEDIIGKSIRPNQKRQSMYFSSSAFVSMPSFIVLPGDFVIRWRQKINRTAAVGTVWPVVGNASNNGYVGFNATSKIVTATYGGTTATFTAIDTGTNYELKRVGSNLTLVVDGVSETKAFISGEVQLNRIGRNQFSNFFGGNLCDLHIATIDAGGVETAALNISHATKTGASAGIAFDRSGGGKHSTVTASNIDVFCHKELGFGSNTLELEGYTEDTTTYPVTALIPLLTNLSTDCLGNPAQYTGRAKYSLSAVGGSWSAPATGEIRDSDDIILAARGSRFFYGVDGETPTVFDLTDITGGNVADILFSGGRGTALYGVAQVEPTLTKIMRWV